tara:strand:- start:1537 stop:5094 length:3558 start_codon:yes stop_codon:yes gene_type:complete
MAKLKKIKQKKKRKYQTAGFNQVEYGPNIAQSGALDQNQLAYLQAGASNYQTGLDISQGGVDNQLEMLQQQQEESTKATGNRAANELFKKENNLLKRLKEKFQKNRNTNATPETTTTGSTPFIPSSETVTAKAFPELTPPTFSVEAGSPNVTGFGDYGSGQMNIPRVGDVGNTPTTTVPTNTTTNVSTTSAPPVPDNLITDVAKPTKLLGQSGKVGTALSNSALGTTSSGATTGFSQFGAAASTYALPAVIIGEGTKYLSDDDDPTTMNVGETAGTALSGAGQGAGIGMAVGGPVGAGIGAIIGTGVGLYKGIKGRNKARDFEADNTTDFAVASDDRKQELLDNQSAYRQRRRSFLSTASTDMQRGTYYQGEMGGMNPNMSFKQKLRSQMAMGGIKPMNNQGDMVVYGPTHEQGGVMRDQTTELEGGGMKNGQALPGEVVTQIMDDGGMNREYYFSDHLKNPSTGNTFAEDYINTGGMNQDAKQTFAKLQELVAGRTDKDRSPQTIAEDGGYGAELPTMSSDTIQGLSSSQNVAKLKFEKNIERKGLNPSSRSVKSNTTVSKDSDGNFIYRYITPTTEKENGGYGKKLDEISDQLAGASKMHAGQSKKIESMAEQLMKKKFNLGGVNAPLMLQNPMFPATTPPPIGYGGFTVSAPGSGTQGGMTFSKSGYSGPIRPSATTGGGMKVTSFPNQPAVRGGVPAVRPGGVPSVVPKGGVPSVVPRPTAIPKPGFGSRLLSGMLTKGNLLTSFMLDALPTGGMGGGSGSDLTGQGHVGGQQLYNTYTDDNGVTYNQNQDVDGSVTGVPGKWYNEGDNSANPDGFPTIYPQFQNQPEEVEDPVEDPAVETEDPVVDVNNIENSKPKFKVDEDLKGTQQEINDFFKTPDPDLPGQTYGDQYGVDDLDVDGKLGPKTKAAIKTFEMAKEREADFDEARNFNQEAVDGQVAQDPVVGNIDGDADDVPITEDSDESGILDRLFGNSSNARMGLAGAAYAANLLNARKNLKELEELKVTPEKITPDRIGKIKITNEAERKLVQESTNAALNQAGSPAERIALLSQQQSAIGQAEEGRRNKQLAADLEVDMTNNKNAFTAEIYNVSNDFKAQIENMQIDAAAKKGKIDIMDKFANAISTMALDANKMEMAYKNMREYGEAMSGGIGVLNEKFVETLMNLGMSKADATAELNKKKNG